MTVLFLGYDNVTTLITFLEQQGLHVVHTKEKVSKECFEKADIVISFGYRHLLTERQLNWSKRPVINIHISF